jgi:sulfate permease, SulP family
MQRGGVNHFEVGQLPLCNKSLTSKGTKYQYDDWTISVGVILSLVLYLERVFKPRIVTRVPDPRLPERAFSSDPDLPQCPQLRFLRIDGSLFLYSMDHIEEAFAGLEAEAPERKHLAIVASGINFADLAGGDVLVKEAKKRQARGDDMCLVNVKQGPWEALEKCEGIEVGGVNNVVQTTTAAVTGIFQKLDKAICRHCTQRIFRECRTVPVAGQ